MQSLFLKGSKTTPEFNYDIENFSMSIIGESDIDELNPFYNTITMKIKFRYQIRFNMP